MTLAYNLLMAAKYKKDMPPAEGREVPMAEEEEVEVGARLPRDMVHGLDEGVDISSKPTDLEAEEGIGDISSRLYAKGFDVGYDVGKHEAMIGNPRDMSFDDYEKSDYFLKIPDRMRVNYSGVFFKEGWIRGYSMGYDAGLEISHRENKEVGEDLKEAIFQIRRKPQIKFVYDKYLSKALND